MNKHLDQHIGNLVVLMAVVSYFQLFRLMAIPYSIRILSQIVVIVIMILLIIIRIIYHPEVKIKMNFAVPVLLLFFGAIPSYFIAKSYQNQDFIAYLLLLAESSGFTSFIFLPIYIKYG